MADFGAAWLGWDIARGVEASQPDLPDLHDITMTPRKYGFHGTLKPPFRLADGLGLGDLDKATSLLAASIAPAICDGLVLETLGRFLALVPQGDTGAIRHLAEACVRDLDRFRAPASDAELARRRKAGLSAQQEALLMEWGYPYVMDELQFHLTLSGRLPKDGLKDWAGHVRYMLPDLPAPFVIDQIALCGARADGRFQLIHRYALTG